MIKRIRRKAAALWENQDGSEAIEMVWSTATLASFILIGLMFLTYVVELNLVNTATKRVVRNIEVTGAVSTHEMNRIFNDFLGPTTSLTDRKIEISNVEYCQGNKIQLKDTFRCTGSATYVVPLIEPGHFSEFKISLPIKTAVSGMSECYWSLPSNGG